MSEMEELIGKSPISPIGSTWWARTTIPHSEYMVDYVARYVGHHVFAAGGYNANVVRRFYVKRSDYNNCVDAYQL